MLAHLLVQKLACLQSFAKHMKRLWSLHFATNSNSNSHLPFYLYTYTRVHILHACQTCGTWPSINQKNWLQSALSMAFVNVLHMCLYALNKGILRLLRAFYNIKYTLYMYVLYVLLVFLCFTNVHCIRFLYNPASHFQKRLVLLFECRKKETVSTKEQRSCRSSLMYCTWTMRRSGELTH